MEKFIVDFVVNHFKTKTSKKKQINNQQLDLLIQTKLGTNPLSDSGIRELIHYIRVYVPILNTEGDSGWICASGDGYYLSYNPIDILQNMQSFESRIRKMMKVHSKGMEVLLNKIYYKQAEIKF